MMKKHNMLSWLLAFCLCFAMAMPALAYPITPEENELPGVYNEATFDPANPEASRVGDKPEINESYSINEEELEDEESTLTFETMPTEMAIEARNEASGTMPLYSYTYDNVTKSYTNSLYSGIVAYVYTADFTSDNSNDSTCLYIGFDNASGKSVLETGVSLKAGERYYHPFCNTVNGNGNTTADSSSKSYAKNQNVKLKAQITSYSNGFATVQIYVNDELIFANKKVYLGTNSGKVKICNGVYDGNGTSTLSEMNFNTVKILSGNTWAQVTPDWPRFSSPAENDANYHFSYRFSPDHYIKYVKYNHD